MKWNKPNFTQDENSSANQVRNVKTSVSVHAIKFVQRGCFFIVHLEVVGNFFFDALSKINFDFFEEICTETSRTPHDSAIVGCAQQNRLPFTHEFFEHVVREPVHMIEEDETGNRDVVFAEKLFDRLRVRCDFVRQTVFQTEKIFFLQIFGTAIFRVVTRHVHAPKIVVVNRKFAHYSVETVFHEQTNLTVILFFDLDALRTRNAQHGKRRVAVEEPADERGPELFFELSVVQFALFLDRFYFQKSIYDFPATLTIDVAVQNSREIPGGSVPVIRTFGVRKIRDFFIT